jgi:hypothetical protein
VQNKSKSAFQEEKEERASKKVRNTNLYEAKTGKKA